MTSGKHQVFGRSNIYRLWSRSSNYSVATFEELLLITPHDIENESHNIKLKMTSLVLADD